MGTVTVVEDTAGYGTPLADAVAKVMNGLLIPIDK
jgi:hypothetical protein